MSRPPSRPPLPPEPDWAPPPRPQAPRRAAGESETQPTADPALPFARGAGVAAFVALAGGAFGGTPPVRAAVLLVGLAIVGALGWRARRAGMPASEVVSVTLVTLVLTGAISLGVALVVAFGACLVLLGKLK